MKDKTNKRRGKGNEPLNCSRCPSPGLSNQLRRTFFFLFFFCPSLRSSYHSLRCGYKHTSIQRLVRARYGFAFPLTFFFFSYFSVVLSYIGLVYPPRCVIEEKRTQIKRTASRSHNEREREKERNGSQLKTPRGEREEQ